MKILTHWIEQNLRLSPSLQEKLFFSFIVLIAIWAIRLIVLAIIGRRTDDASVLYRWRKTSENVSLAIVVLLTVRYLCDPRQRRSSEHEIWEEILTAFDEQASITFAYPTQRICYRPVEKENTRLSVNSQFDVAS